MSDNTRTQAGEPKQITVMFINNDGGGFADNLSVDAGTTITEFVESKSDRSPNELTIRVNRNPVSSGYVLEDGDRVTLTPTKIEGAGEPEKITVMFINNDGGGFADHVSVTLGMTITDFVSSKSDRSPDELTIRVNRNPVSRGYVLQDGDRVTLTPTKIEGARD